MPELVGADTADFPNKGETPLNVHCVTVFPELRLDSVGLPPSTHNALTLYFREMVISISFSVVSLYTTLSYTAALYDQGCFLVSSRASFSCRSAFSSLK